MSERDGIELARDFVPGEFVDRGMIADLNVHWDMSEDGMPKPHAHVMLTMRAVDENGFGQKARDWNRTEMVERWRERWAAIANERLAELDIDSRIDHRSLEAQGIALEPQTQIGASAQRIEGEGSEAADRAEMHREIARGNGARIIANPDLGLEAITEQQSTFTRRDMAKFAHRHSDGIDQFNKVVGAMRNAPDLVELGRDERGEDRFSTRAMIEAERRLHRAAELMAERERHEVNDGDRETAMARAEARGLVLSTEQSDALAHITDGRDLGVVVGHAGTGKSAMLGVAREAWEAAGYEVRGVALSGIAAENLESGSGISSRTIASMEHGWGQGRDILTARDVLVVDEAGMVGTRQLERMLSHAAEARAKVVLVGDPQQLQSIEAGAAFRSIHERHGGVEIGEVRRQCEDWQRDATRDLATGRTRDAIHAYHKNGMVHEASTREQARGALIERWDRDRRASPDKSRIILTHTNDEVRTLNEAARERMRDAGDLGQEVRVTVARGERNFASGDRVMFLQNEHGLGVKNGTLGAIEQVSPQSMTVRTDDGRNVSFDLKDYHRIDHGYAATIHKAQSMTVDRTHVLATPGMDAYGSYVALSRHRDRIELHYGRDDFANQIQLTRTLSRDRAKDMASDYEQIDPARDYAERRGITFRERVVEMVRKIVPEKVRGMFDGLRSPSDAPGPDGGQRREEWHSIDVPQLRIVEQSVWEQAHALKTERGRLASHMKRRAPHLLSGLLRCGCCGSGMSVHDCEKTGKTRIRCSAVRESGSCSNRRIICLRDVERLVLSGMVGELKDPRLIETYVRNYNRERERLAGNASAERMRLEAKRDRFEGERQRNIDLVIKYVIAEEDAKQRIAELKEQWLRVEAELAALEEAPTPISLHPATLDRYIATVNALADTIAGHASAEDDRGSLVADFRALVHSVIVHPKGPWQGFEVEVKGKLAALVGGGFFPEARYNSGSYLVGRFTRFPLPPRNSSSSSGGKEKPPEAVLFGAHF